MSRIQPDVTEAMTAPAAPYAVITHWRPGRKDSFVRIYAVLSTADGRVVSTHETLKAARAAATTANQTL